MNQIIVPKPRWHTKLGSLVWLITTLDYSGLLLGGGYGAAFAAAAAAATTVAVAAATIGFG